MVGLVRQGLQDFGRAPLASATAGLATLAGALAVAAAVVSVGLSERAGVLLVGFAVSSLLGSCGRSLALTAYARPGRPWLAAGLARMPALITVGAVELTVELSLVCGAALALSRAGVPSPLACALVIAPVLFLCTITFGAARVAVVLVTRGVTPSRALVHGFDVVLRRLPSLLRLAGALFLCTLPLGLGAAALSVAALRHLTLPSAALQAALALVLMELAALWSYAALANLVGRDPRLVTG